jgi:hypothetical protein
MRPLQIPLALILFSLLTVVTQVGGVVFLISTLTFGPIDMKLNRRWATVGPEISFIRDTLLTFRFPDCSAGRQTLRESAFTDI